MNATPRYQLRLTLFVLFLYGAFPSGFYGSKGLEDVMVKAHGGNEAAGSADKEMSGRIGARACTLRPEQRAGMRRGWGGRRLGCSSVVHLNQRVSCCHTG